MINANSYLIGNNKRTTSKDQTKINKTVLEEYFRLCLDYQHCHGIKNIKNGRKNDSAERKS